MIKTWKITVYRKQVIKGVENEYVSLVVNQGWKPDDVDAYAWELGGHRGEIEEVPIEECIKTN